MNSDGDFDYDALLNHVAMQMASSNLSRRQSRSSAARPSMTPNRRSTRRIEKPASAHNSPHGLERRRTTSAVKQYASLDDHYNCMFGVGDLHSNVTKTPPTKQFVRPVSWHPRSSASKSKRLSSTTDASGQPVPPLTNFPQEDATPVESLTPAGFDARMSDPLDGSMPVYDPQLQNPAVWDQSISTPGWPMTEEQPLGYSGGDALLFPSTDPLAFPSNNFNSNQPLLTTSPTHYDNFLPIQQPATSEKPPQAKSPAPSEQSSKELVGMGLYDPPEPAISPWRSQFDSSLLAAGKSPDRGKGLKLEDSFEPPPDLGQDDDDEQQVDDALSAPEPIYQEPAVVDSTDLQSMLLQQNQATNMAGQSFLFDDEHDLQVSNPHWWYNQLPLKNLSAQDVGVGYGWI